MGVGFWLRVLMWMIWSECTYLNEEDGLCRSLCLEQTQPCFPVHTTSSITTRDQVSGKSLSVRKGHFSVAKRLFTPYYRFNPIL